jgi:hypothetical protein
MPGLPQREASMTSEYAAPAEATQAPDQQGERGELPSRSASGGSVATAVTAVLLVFYTLFFAAMIYRRRPIWAARIKSPGREAGPGIASRRML